ncbi:MAG: ribosome assembly cofactor RimP [Flavobacteriales bacterium]|jgi:ribosome maturation factor RimP
MITKEQVAALVEEKIAGTDLFIVEINVKPGNKIDVFIDRDSGLALEDCLKVSRHVEGNLDREVEDYSLDVSSPGVGRPLKLKRQYFKNIGRNVDIKLLDGSKLEGTLTAADEEKIVVHTRTKEEIEGKKGKKWVERDTEVPFDSISETKITISFK